MGIIKIVPIGQRAFTVRELTLAQIRELDNITLKADVIPYLLASGTDTTVEEILPMAPSDLEPLVDAFVEVNKSFFGQAVKVEETETARLFEMKLRLISMTACFYSSTLVTE